MPDREIMKRLNAAIDREGWTGDRERLARGIVHTLRDAVSKLIEEAVKEERAKRPGCPNCQG